MNYSSKAASLGSVTFPAVVGQRVYMREFRKETGLPADLAVWQETVDVMLAKVDTDGPIYLMIDQGVVRAKTTQRRPGLHIDGYWNPGLSAHDNRPAGHIFAKALRVHGPTPDHGSRPAPARHRSGPGHTGWEAADFSFAEDILLASDITASRVLLGEWSGKIGMGGDCSHIDTSGLIEMPLEAGQVYAGNVTALHESLPVAVDTYRTLVRLNVPGWSHTQ